MVGRIYRSGSHRSDGPRAETAMQITYHIITGVAPNGVCLRNGLVASFAASGDGGHSNEWRTLDAVRPNSNLVLHQPWWHGWEEPLAEG